MSASEFFRSGVELAAANVACGVNDLALQVARVDDVEIDQAQRADAGRGQVERERRAETAGANAEHARSLEFLLALDANFGQDEMARVAGEIVASQLGQRGWGNGDRHGTGSPVFFSLSGVRRSGGAARGTQKEGRLDAR